MELKAIEKGTKFLLLDRIRTSKFVNKHEEKFKSWIGRKCVLKSDIYITEYPNNEFPEGVSTYMRLKFSNTEGVNTSGIESVEQEGSMVTVTTINFIYKLEQI